LEEVEDKELFLNKLNINKNILNFYSRYYEISIIKIGKIF